MSKLVLCTPFEDFNYEAWAAKLGIVAIMEPRVDGLFDLVLVGAPADLEQFEAEASLPRSERE
jgi:hypothetical protein